MNQTYRKFRTSESKTPCEDCDNCVWCEYEFDDAIYYIYECIGVAEFKGKTDKPCKDFKRKDE